MRYYTDKGVHSKGACLRVQDTDGKYFLLIPTTNLPATRTAPATVEKTVLTDNAVTQVEGLQTNEQKTYTFNYHRDNLIQLSKYKGRNLAFLEENADHTGERFTGSVTYGRTGVEVDGIEQGEIYITVTSADDEPLTDVRDIVKPTAIVTTPLEDVELVGTNSIVIPVETSPEATVTVTSGAVTIATATYENGKITITGVAAGNTLVNVTTSATGEATSYRTIAVTVTAA